MSRYIYAIMQCHIQKSNNYDYRATWKRTKCNGAVHEGPEITNAFMTCWRTPMLNAVPCAAGTYSKQNWATALSGIWHQIRENVSRIASLTTGYSGFGIIFMSLLCSTVICSCQLPCGVVNYQRTSYMYEYDAATQGPTIAILFACLSVSHSCTSRNGSRYEHVVLTHNTVIIHFFVAKVTSWIQGFTLE